jgi:hypothetical protein
MSDLNLISILENYQAPINLRPVIQSCLRKLNNSASFSIDESINHNISSDHYYRIYSGRMKNPNGVALLIPGLPESTENFHSKDVMLKLVSVTLDEGRGSIAIWLSENGEILGCMEFLK